ncbi:hypothetical protein HYV10_04000 [Candidatus Dependentiae bacterium]|nr:hypothetical protein [Candidatus Dependentiae bacterium]
MKIKLCIVYILASLSLQCSEDDLVSSLLEQSLHGNIEAVRKIIDNSKFKEVPEYNLFMAL